MRTAILTMLVLLAASGPADAVQPPNASYGAVQLAATTATKIPTAPLANRAAIAVKNLDTVRIWCGRTSAVTDSTGWPVEPNGGAESFSVSWRGTADKYLWCYSVGGTAAAAVRYIETISGAVL